MLRIAQAAHVSATGNRCAGSAEGCSEVVLDPSSDTASIDAEEWRAAP